MGEGWNDGADDAEIYPETEALTWTTLGPGFGSFPPPQEAERSGPEVVAGPLDDIPNPSHAHACQCPGCRPDAQAAGGINPAEDDEDA